MPCASTACRCRPGRTLLDGIDLAIPERGLFGIVGPNGSGKTTLQRARSDWCARARAALRCSGARRPMETGRACAPHRLCRAARREPLGPDRARDAAAAAPGPRTDPALVARFELDALIDRRHASLSGGERARVGVARALAHDPRPAGGRRARGPPRHSAPPPPDGPVARQRPHARRARGAGTICMSPAPGATSSRHDRAVAGWWRPDRPPRCWSGRTPRRRPMARASPPPER